MTINAYSHWKSNAELIADVAALGYLSDEWLILDPTYGEGVFWRTWRPEGLVTHDLKLDGVDFTQLPHLDREFEAVVFDPPYKLNGTPDPAVDARYGVDKSAPWKSRHALIFDGITECARVCDRYLLIKCQDQVCSGAVRWQTREFADWAEAVGFTLVDRFDKLGGRAQPKDRRQVHARRNASTLLVLAR